MIKKSEIEDILIEVARDVLTSLGGDPTSIVAGKNTVFFGERSVFDSLALVSMVVELERQLEDKLGVKISLSDERIMQEPTSVLVDSNSLIAYIEKLIAEKQ
jgi:acyl carrier protein